MGGGGDLTLINGFVGREGDGGNTRLGACLAERCVRWRTDYGDLQRGTSNSSPQHEGRNEAGREPSPPPNARFLPSSPPHAPSSCPPLLLLSSPAQGRPIPPLSPYRLPTPPALQAIHQKPSISPTVYFWYTLHLSFLPDLTPDTLLLTCHKQGRFIYSSIIRLTLQPSPPRPSFVFQSVTEELVQHLTHVHQRQRASWPRGLTKTRCLQTDPERWSGRSLMRWRISGQPSCL